MFSQSVLRGRIYSISAKTGVDISYVTVKVDGTCRVPPVGETLAVLSHDTCIDICVVKAIYIFHL